MPLLAAFAGCGAEESKSQGPQALPDDVRLDLSRWLGNTYPGNDMMKCSFPNMSALTTGRSDAPKVNIVVNATNVDPGAHPDAKFSGNAIVAKTAQGWACLEGQIRRGSDSFSSCPWLSLTCAAGMETSPEAAPEEQRPAGPISAPKCMKAAAALIKNGGRCKIDMRRYSPKAICESYIRGDNFTDEQAAGRLSNFSEPMGTQTVCQSIGLAVRGDRI